MAFEDIINAPENKDLSTSQLEQIRDQYLQTELPKQRWYKSANFKQRADAAKEFLAYSDNIIKQRTATPAKLFDLGLDLIKKKGKDLFATGKTIQRFNPLGGQVTVDFPKTKEEKRIETRELEILKKERQARVESGAGFTDALLFGLVDAPLIRSQFDPRALPEKFQPEGVGESVAHGLGRVAGDLPLFAAGPAFGFGASRALDAAIEKDRRQKPLSANDILDIAVEAGKGVIEGYVLAGTGRLTNVLSGTTKAKTGAGIQSLIEQSIGRSTPRSQIARRVLQATVPGIDALALIGTSSALDQRLPDVEGSTSAVLLSYLFKAKNGLKAIKGEASRARTVKKVAELTGEDVSTVKEKLRTPEKAESFLKEQQKVITENAEMNRKVKDALVTKFDDPLVDNAIKITKIDNALKNPIDVKRTLWEKQVDEIIKSSGSLEKKAQNIISVASGLKVDKRSTAKILNDYFIKRWGKQISDTSQSGKKMVDTTYKIHLEGERRGGADNLNLEKAMSPIVKKRGNINVTIDPKRWDLVRKLLDYDEVRQQKAISDSALSAQKKFESIKIKNDIRVVMDEVHKNLVDKGAIQIGKDGKPVYDNKGKPLPLQYRKNLFPRKFDFDKIKSDPIGFFKELADKNYLPKDFSLEMLKGKSKKEMISFAENQLHNMKNFTGVRESFEYQRRFNDISDKWYRTDPAVLFEYVQEAAMRAEQIRHFGPHWEKLDQHLLNIAAELGPTYGKKRAEIEWNKAHHLMNAVFGLENKGDPGLNGIVQALQNYQTVAKMGASSISQTTQMFSAIYRSGSVLPLIKAIRKRLVNKDEAIDTIRKAGINLSITRDSLMEVITGKGGAGEKLAQGVLKANQFIRFDANNRTMAGLSGMFFIDHLDYSLSKRTNKLIKKYGSLEKIPSKVLDRKLAYETRQYTDLGLNIGALLKRGVIKKGKWKVESNEREKRRAAHKFEIDTNFRARAMDLPQFRHSSPGRLITQFRSFMYSQSILLRDHVLKEALRFPKERRLANITPLAYTALFGTASGVLVNEIRAMLFKSLPEIIEGSAFWAASPLAAIYKVLKNNPDKQYSETIKFLAESLSAGGVLGVLDQVISVTKYGDPGFGPLADTIGDLFKIVAETKRIFEAEKSRIPIYSPGVSFLIQQTPLGNYTSKIFREAVKEEKGLTRKSKYQRYRSRFTRKYRSR